MKVLRSGHIMSSSCGKRFCERQSKGILSAHGWSNTSNLTGYIRHIGILCHWWGNASN
jgi:hypothetical protein